MSLSRWLRDYLYIPLGGNRGGDRRRDINLILTMLLGGLWHGAAWTFVLWGAFHGLGLLVERRLGLRLHPVVACVATFHFVCFGWILFRAESLGAAGDVLGRLFGAWTVESAQLTPVAVALIAAMLATHFWPRSAGERAIAAASHLPALVTGVTFALWLVIVEQLGPEGVAPFIYFQF